MKRLHQRFEDAALPHVNAVYRAAAALCHNRTDAEDLVQMTFLKAMQKFGTYKSVTNCRAWLLTILRNTWIDQLRHKKYRRQFVPLDETLVETASPVEQTTWHNADDLLENFSDEDIIDALARLPDDQRLTLFLVDVEQYSQEEVAQITGVAVGTVKSRTSRARAALKKLLDGYARQMGYARGEK